MPAEITPTTWVKISVGGLCATIVGGIVALLAVGVSMRDKISGLGADSRVMVTEVKHLAGRVDETNARLQSIEEKANGHLERLLQVHLRQGEFATRIQSLENRVGRLEKGGD